MYNHEKFIEKLFALRSEEAQMTLLKDYMLSLPFEEFDRFLKWQSTEFKAFCESLETRDDMTSEEKEHFISDFESMYKNAFSLKKSLKKAA